MPKFFVPACGDRLRLTAPWKFPVYLEHRNMKFAQGLGLLAKSNHGWGVYEGAAYTSEFKKVQVELLVGTIIECARVYIRQFSKSALKVEKDFDSITWVIQKEKGKAGKGKPSGRFWVKLPDCYAIEYELDHDSLYRDRVKLIRSIQEG